MTLIHAERSNLTPVVDGTKMIVHPSAEVLPRMAGEEWDDFKAAILKAGGNLQPVVFHDGALVDGRNRARAVEELRVAGHSVELRHIEWEGNGSETATEFILRTNLQRRHLTAEQRVAILLKLLPQIEKEASQRQSLARIKSGEKRNPHGRGGKPKLPGADATPPSVEEQRRHRQEKEKRSTAGRLASQAGVTVHKAKQVMKTTKEVGPAALDQLAAGTATTKQLLGKKSKRREAPNPHSQMEFRKYLKGKYHRLLAEHDREHQKAVRAYLIKLIRAEQKQYGEKGNSIVAAVVRNKV